MEIDKKILSQLNMDTLKIISNNRDHSTILALDQTTGKKVIFKIFESIEDEKHVFQILKSCDKKAVTAPILLRDVSDGYYYFILEAKGPDLGFLFKQLDNYFTTDTVMLIGYKMIKVLKDLHEIKVVHNSISPGHILISEKPSNQELYLIDFENAIKQKIISFKEREIHPEIFSSLNVHMDIYPTYRDDIESLLYVLFYFLTEGKFIFEKKTGSEQLTFKLGFYPEMLADQVPEELIHAFNYTKSLNFDTSPNYSYIFSLFHQYFDSRSSSSAHVEYDWITAIRKKMTLEEYAAFLKSSRKKSNVDGDHKHGKTKFDPSKIVKLNSMEVFTKLAKEYNME